MPKALLRQAAACGPCLPSRRCRASRARNHGSILQELKISSLVQPSRIACATCSSRSGVGVPSAARIAFLSSPRPRPSISISSRPVSPVSSPRSAFCRLSWKVRPIAITSPTDFIEVVSVVRGAGEFLERKARDFGDDVIDRRLERGRRGAAGDVVGDLIERVADRELGRDLGDRKAGGLRGQRRGARHARIHLDHDHAAVGRIDAELHVGAAGLHPDLAQHRERGVAHDLVFLVGQRQRRRDRDGIAGVHAHRIEVLDRADDDAIVLLVAHHLHLELFPAEHGFLDQDFVGRGGVDAALDDVDEFFLVVGDAAAGAAHGEGGADDRGQADLGERHQRFAERMFLVALAALVLAERPLPLAALPARRRTASRVRRGICRDRISSAPRRWRAATSASPGRSWSWPRGTAGGPRPCRWRPRWRRSSRRRIFPACPAGAATARSSARSARPWSAAAQSRRE